MGMGSFVDGSVVVHRTTRDDGRDRSWHSAEVRAATSARLVVGGKRKSRMGALNVRE